MEARTGIGRWIQGFEGIAEIAAQETPLHSFSEILDWLEDRKKSQHIQINQIPLEACQPWYYDHSEGVIRNPEGSFFRIGGMVSRDLEGDEQSQPIILQPEIGYLGIVCRRFGGVWHFLMQASSFCFFLPSGSSTMRLVMLMVWLGQLRSQLPQAMHLW